MLLQIVIKIMIMMLMMCLLEYVPSFLRLSKSDKRYRQGFEYMHICFLLRANANLHIAGFFQFL